MWPRWLQQLPGHAALLSLGSGTALTQQSQAARRRDSPQCLLETTGMHWSFLSGLLLGLQFGFERVAMSVGSEAANGDASLFLFQTDSGIQALFAGIDSLCKKYSKETSQVSMPCGCEPRVSGLLPRYVLYHLHCTARLLCSVAVCVLPWSILWSLVQCPADPHDSRTDLRISGLDRPLGQQLLREAVLS